MNLYVAVTDNDLYRSLLRQKDLTEVNFWQPGGNRRFRALAPGELFLFKLHAPHHFIVGGGFFVHFTFFPYSTAWEFFGVKNGAASLPEMRRRIERYRRVTDPAEDYVIGCTILGDPFFFGEERWIPAPEDFAPSIVRGKTYRLDTEAGRSLWHEVQWRRQEYLAPGRDGQQRIYGEPVMVRPRRGPGTFRALVTDAYGRTCAVTGERALPALEAAPILPLTEGGRHDVDNGLLLRADLRRLFDSGYVTVAPDYRFRVSRRLARTFEGASYSTLDGQPIRLPERPEHHPRRQFLEWHGERVFRG